MYMNMATYPYRYLILTRRARDDDGLRVSKVSGTVLYCMHCTVPRKAYVSLAYVFHTYEYYSLVVLSLISLSLHSADITHTSFGKLWPTDTNTHTHTHKTPA